MDLHRRYFWLAVVAFHLLLIVGVCWRDTFAILSQGQTIFPRKFDGYWKSAENGTAALLGRGLSKSNPPRLALGTYLNGAGIEAGYGFFAPHVPGAYKLVFELHYPDGRTEYELPSVNASAAGLHLVSLLDFIGHTQDDVVREGMIKFLSYAVWREHSNVSMIRAVFGTVNVPTIAEFEQGKRESYQVLSAYDITFEPKPVPRP